MAFDEIPGTEISPDMSRRENYTDRTLRLARQHQRITDVHPAVCTHSSKQTLSQSGEPEHAFCPNCKRHWYAGKTYSRQEWNDYVNS